MSHTPGPWRRSGDNIIQTNHITRDVWTIPHEEGDLDLIAAAPDLLAVCQEWIACWNSPRDMDQIVKNCELIEKTEAAIAKATTPPPAPPLP